MTSNRKPRQDEPDDPDTPILEWAFGGIGLALFAGAVIVTSLGLIDPREPPSITIKVEQPASSAGLFRVDYSAFNAGDETATDVHLLATLTSSGEVVEQQEARIDLLPGGSTSRGGLFFKHDPKGLALDIRPVSYQEP